MKVLNPASRDFWQKIADSCPWATFFHTPTWAEVFAQTFPQYTLATIGFEMENGAHAAVPFVARQKNGIFTRKKKYLSMEPGVYGGIIANQDLSQNDTNRIIGYLTTIRNASGRIVGNPFRQLSMPGTLKSKKMFTHIVDLTPGADMLYKQFSRGQKSNINQAKKRNIKICTAEDEGDITSYFEIYQDTLKRWGKTAAISYPLKFFLNLFRQKSPHIQFWLAKKDGNIIAGIIVLSWNQILSYWHGCALQSEFKNYPNNLLHLMVMQWGCSNNFLHYDMGPSMEMEGVIRFKESFGAKKVYFESYRWR